MSHLAKDMTPDVTWKDITPGCNIYEGGTSSVVETGDWRTMKPVIDWDKCRQCLLCAPVCPDMSIPVNGEGKREDFDYFFCKGCGICAAFCPKSVLAVSELGKIQVVNGDACIGCGQCELRCPDYAIFVDRVKEEAAQ